jgi:hypothetical protein
MPRRPAGRAVQIMNPDIFHTAGFAVTARVAGGMFLPNPDAETRKCTCISCTSCKQPRSRWCVCALDWLVCLCHVPGQQNPAQQCMQFRDRLSVFSNLVGKASGCCERAYAGGEGDVSGRSSVAVEAQSLVSSECPLRLGGGDINRGGYKHGRVLLR